jgi:hypothetical protein
MPRDRLWITIGAVALAAGIALLAACAAGPLTAVNTLAMASKLPSNEPQWIETNRVTLAYSVADVYARLVEGVEQNGRKIIERRVDSQSLLVSYPLSLFNWGGTVRIICAPSESGTTITILGDGRDEISRVRVIGDEVLEEVDAALRRQPRTL